MQARTENQEMITQINVTPLVDVVLVLLIVLMVTASYLVSKSIPVDLPNAASTESVHTTLAITIDDAGTTYVDAKRVAEPELRTAIRRARRSSSDVRAVIAADGGSRHRSVVSVIDTLRQEGIVRFAINVDPTDIARAR